MTKRLIPESMKVQTAAAQSVAETARFENTEQDKCPVCHVPMRRSVANDIPVMWCDTHAIAMPVKD
jgi:uncharacterized paraquat-inducible protein A